MNICIECNKDKIKTVLRCGVCDDKLKERIKNKMLMSYNWHLKIIMSYLNNKVETITKYNIN